MMETTSSVQDEQSLTAPLVIDMSGTVPSSSLDLGTTRDTDTGNGSTEQLERENPMVKSNSGVPMIGSLERKDDTASEAGHPGSIQSVDNVEATTESSEQVEPRVDDVKTTMENTREECVQSVDSLKTTFAPSDAMKTVSGDINVKLHIGDSSHNVNSTQGESDSAKVYADSKVETYKVQETAMQAVSVRSEGSEIVTLKVDNISGDLGDNSSSRGDTQTEMDIINCDDNYHIDTMYNSQNIQLVDKEAECETDEGGHGENNGIILENELDDIPFAIVNVRSIKDVEDIEGTQLDSSHSKDVSIHDSNDVGVNLDSRIDVLTKDTEEEYTEHSVDNKNETVFSSDNLESEKEEENIKSGFVISSVRSLSEEKGIGEGISDSLENNQSITEEIDIANVENPIVQPISDVNNEFESSSKLSVKSSYNDVLKENFNDIVTHKSKDSLSIDQSNYNKSSGEKSHSISEASRSSSLNNYVDHGMPIIMPNSCISIESGSYEKLPVLASKQTSQSSSQATVRASISSPIIDSTNALTSSSTTLSSFAETTSVMKPVSVPSFAGSAETLHSPVIAITPLSEAVTLATTPATPLSRGTTTISDIVVSQADAAVEVITGTTPVAGTANLSAVTTTTAFTGFVSTSGTVASGTLAATPVLTGTTRPKIVTSTLLASTSSLTGTSPASGTVRLVNFTATSVLNETVLAPGTLTSPTVAATSVLTGIAPTPRTPTTVGAKSGLGGTSSASRAEPSTPLTAKSRLAGTPPAIRAKGSSTTLAAVLVPVLARTVPALGTVMSPIVSAPSVLAPASDVWTASVNAGANSSVQEPAHITELPPPATTDTGLPVISNIFSIKEEPLDDGLFGVIPASSGGTPITTGTATLGSSNNKASISSVISRLHGKKVTPSVTDMKKAGNLKMTQLNSKDSGTGAKVKSQRLRLMGFPVTQQQQQQQQIKPVKIKTKNGVLRQVKYVYPKGPASNVTEQNKQIKQILTEGSQTSRNTTHTGYAVTGKSSVSSPSQQNSVTFIRPGHELPVKIVYPNVQKAAVTKTIETKKWDTTLVINNSNTKTIVTNLTLPSKPKYILPGETQTSTTSNKHDTVNTKNSSQAENKSKTEVVKKNEDKPKESLDNINTHTVGYATIAQIISRVNPVPMYKPEPIPDHLKGIVEPGTFQCYECGDTFYIEKSLRIHQNRCSMRLQYKCAKCCRKLTFTNKCQLLKHLRSHLDIPKTQGVPIHIKSDSIHIHTVYKEIGEGMGFQWYDEAKCFIVRNEEQCVVCEKEFANENARCSHFRQIVKPFLSCDQCDMYLPNKCSLELHKRLHKMLENRSTYNVDKLCPDCGLHVQGNVSEFCEHLFRQCYHPYRQLYWMCPICKDNRHRFTNKEEVGKHLLAYLENYYKCAQCPMALKTLKNFLVHYRQKHGMLRELRSEVKMIYRCHLCDTLIDDRSFLMTHLDNHVEEFEQEGRVQFVCEYCMSSFGLKMEFDKHQKYHLDQPAPVFLSKECKYCKLVFDDPIKMYQHICNKHTHLNIQNWVEFCDCGCVCKTKNMRITHVCLNKAIISNEPGASDQISQISATSKDVEQSDTMYNCPLCNREVCEIEARVKHIQKHRSKQEYICVGCDRANFTDNHSLRSHEVECLEEKLNKRKTGFHCPLCDRHISSESGLKSHNIYHRNMNQYFCVTCLRIDFETYHDYRSHEIACIAKKQKKISESIQKKKEPLFMKIKKTFVKSKPLPDPAVYVSSDSDAETEQGLGKVRLSLKGVEKEKRFVDRGEKFKCTKCSQEFTRKSKLEEHMNAEHGLHSCHLCGIMYESLSRLKVHLFINHKGKKLVYYCWVCRARKIEKCYTDKSLLEKHLSQKHRMKTWDPARMVPELPGSDKEGFSPEPQILECFKNSTVSVDEPPVKKLKVDGEMTFNCAKCSFICENKTEFHQHIHEHNTDNTVQCLECGLCFAVLPSLRRHLFMVHKIRDFDSYIQENSIQEPQELDNLDYIEREEERISESEESLTGEEDEPKNQLKCKVCHKECDTEHTLQQHMRVHGMAFIKKSRRKVMTSRQAAALSRNNVDDLDGVHNDDIDETPSKKARIESGVSDLGSNADDKDSENYKIVKKDENGSDAVVMKDLKLVITKCD